MTTELIIAALAGALLATVVALLMRGRERQSLQAAVDEARAAQAAAESGRAVAESRATDLLARVTELGAQQAELEAARLSLAQESARLASTLQGTRTELERVRTDHAQQLSAQKAWLQEQMQFFEQKVSVTTAQLLDERSKSFSELNQRELGALVTPFKDQLAEFRQRLEAMHTSETGDRSKLHQQIEHLTQLNQSVSKAAEGLTNALTISSKATGDWGETILQRILEESGLREGHEYRLQHSIESADGGRQQPDAVIFLPQERHVVVDAKVSNKAWKEYCDSSDETTRAHYLAAHLASLRAHIKGLTQRDYTRSPDLKAVEFVLMFVPVEAALLTALSQDQSLYGEAYKSKIVLVTPSTLMAVTKLIEGMWAFENRSKKVDEIAEMGRKLYEKLHTFSVSFIKVGEQLTKAQAQFETSWKQLSTGNGNAIRLAGQLRGMGINADPGKLLPPALVEADPEGDTDGSPDDISPS